MKRLHVTALAIVVAVGALIGVPVLAAAQDSAAPVINPLRQDIALPGSPFTVANTPDGQYVFASQSGSATGIAIVEENGTSSRAVGTIPTQNPTFGLAITSDGKYLLDAIQKNSPSNPLPAGVQIIDVQKAIAGEPDAVLGTIPVTAGSGPITVALSNDDHYAFVADEDNETVGVIDLQRATTAGVEAGDLIGYIPVEGLPVGLAFTPDGRYLYVTNEEAAPTHADFNLGACNIPKPGGGTRPGAEGTVTVVDLQQAVINPAGSAIANPYVGCSPVRIELSDDGTVAWITDRASNQLAAYDTERLRTDPTNSLISETPVGVAPVGLQLFDGGRLIAVANSNRFTTGQAGSLSIVDTRRALRGTGESATLATFTSGEFPRGFGLSPDGQTLYLAEYSSNDLAIFPVPSLVADAGPAGEFAFNVSTNGTGSGTVGCRIEGRPEGPCEAEYEAGLEVDVIPHPAPGSQFAEWIGACGGSGACQVKVDKAKALGAVFKTAPSSSGGGDKGGAPNPPTLLRLGAAKVQGGRATLAVTVSGPGTVVASGKGVVTAEVKATRAGRLLLKLKLTAGAKKTLSRTGVLKSKVKVVFRPSAGASRTASRKLAFRSRHRHRQD